MSKWQIIKVKYPLKEGCPWTVFGERDAWIAFGTFEEAKGYVWSRLAAALLSSFQEEALAQQFGATRSEEQLVALSKHALDLMLHPQAAAAEYEQRQQKFFH